MRFAIITSRFNEEVTEGLKKGAIAYLTEKGLGQSMGSTRTIDEFEAPGAFEIPLIAQKLAKTRRYDGIICLGCVIKGDTAHFEFISLGATIGLMQSTLSAEIPITFGILTTYTDDQAILRSQDNPENKGREAAAACYETAQTLREISELR